MEINNYNVQLRQLILAGMFMAFAAFFIIWQIPLYNFLAIDFSLAFLFLSTEYLSKPKVFLITFFIPFFALLSYFPTDIMGVLILEVIFNGSLYFYFIFKTTPKIIRIFLQLFSLLIIVFLFNLLLAYPYYYGFNYEIVFQWNFIEFVILLTTVSTVMRWTLNYLLFLPLRKNLNFHKKC